MAPNALAKPSQFSGNAITEEVGGHTLTFSRHLGPHKCKGKSRKNAKR